MDEIIKTQEYLNYIKEHCNNVQKSWELIQEKCQDKTFDFLIDNFKYFTLDSNIKRHDVSKLSTAEFVPYRRKFFPTDQEKENHKAEIDVYFNLAWEHHKAKNNHHWENWTAKENVGAYPHDTTYVVHNICDWMAMGMKFGDTAKSYYEKNKGKIILPQWSIDFMYEIFDCIYV